MIITGNSNVDCFNRLGFEIDVEGEKVSAYWVGALQIEHFYQSIPIGEKVRSIFAAEKGWKFLSIGTHDIFHLWGAASRGRLTAVFQLMMQRYGAIFRELNGPGKFGWLVFPQPLHEVNFQNVNVTEKDKLDITRCFNRQIAKLCADNGILVINPLKTILGNDGLPSCEYLQEDGLHVNDSGAGLYIEEIAKLTGTSIGFQPIKMFFEPRSETESFCSLLLNNAHMEAERGLEVEGLSSALAGFLSERLKQRGLDIDVDGETELVDSGLLDSLDIVEVYTFAASAMLMDIPFDVSLRDLNTVHKISEYLTEKKGGSLTEKDPQPVQSDFLLSLRGDFNDTAQRAEMLEAEFLISKLDDPSFASFQENIVVACAGSNCIYGIVPFWIALNQARRGDYRGALVSLDHASSPRLQFPFSDPRVQFYRSKWEAEKAPRIWENQVDESVISAAGSGHTEVSRNVSGAIFFLPLMPPRPVSFAAPDASPGAMPPKISIVTPSFNQGIYLEECIESVLSQGYPNLEYIIMDGGSTDQSVTIIKKYEKHLSYWSSGPDDGHYSAVNAGFQRSSGDIMGWLNSDDKLLPGSLYRIAYIFSQLPNVEWITSRPTTIEESGELRHIGDIPIWSHKRYLSGDYEWIQQESTFWKRSLWNKAGCIDTNFSLAGDLELWLRFFRYAQLVGLNCILGAFRFQPSQRSQVLRAKYIEEAEAAIRREQELHRKSGGTVLLPGVDPIAIKGEVFDSWMRKTDPSFRGVTEELQLSLQEIKLAYDSKKGITGKSLEYIIATASHMGEADLVNAVAIAHFLKGNVKEAEAVFHLLRKSSPSNPRTLNNLAVLYYESCEYRKSRELVEQLLSVQTDDVELLNNVRVLSTSLDKLKLHRHNADAGPSMEKQPSGRPLVSVITPSFNQALYIEQNIRSVLDQQYPNFEHIVIDGGSTDGTVEVLERFPHLKWVSEKDNGQSDALNKGFAMASGDIICWLNSDDWLAPEAFHHVAQELAPGQKSVLMGKCLLADPSGKPFKELANPERSFYHLMKYWIPYSIPAQPAIFFVRSLLESVRRCDGTYVDPSLHFAMDHDLWARMMKSARFHHIDRVLSYYRHHDESKTVAKGNVFVKDWSEVFKRYALQDTQAVGIFGDSRGAGELEEFVSGLRAALAYSVYDLGTEWFSEALSKEGSPEWIVWPGELPGAVAPEVYAEAVKLLARIESIGCVKITPWRHDEKDGSVNHAQPKSPSFVFRRFALEELAAEGQLGRQGGEIAAVLAHRGWKTMELRYPVQVTLSGHIECSPLISVVITCYNYGRHLRECVESVLSQSFENYEILIVNDGSTDDTQIIAESLIDESSSKAIRIIMQPNSRKPAVARNNGISQAIGKYILCLDADDKLSPDFLLECARTLEFTPGVSIAYPDQQDFGEVTRFEPHPEYDFTTLTKFNYICSCAAMFPKRVWEIVGGFSTDVGYEDWDFWISCGERGFYGKRTPGAILWYRRHSQGQYSKDRASDQKIKAQIVLNHSALYRPAQIRWAIGVLREDLSALAIDGGLGVIPAIEGPKPVPTTHPAAMEPAGGNRPHPILHALAPKVPRHILFFMYGWNDEGGGTMLPRQLAGALARKGHQVSVIYAAVQPGPAKSACYIEESTEDGVRLFAVYNRPAAFLDLQHPEREVDCPPVRDAVSQVVARLKPDIVHYHNLVSLSMGVAEAISRIGVPTIYTSHNYWALCPRLYLFRDDLSLCAGPSPDGANCADCVGMRGRNGGFARRAEEGRRMFGSLISRHLAVSARMRDIYVANGHDPGRIRVLPQAPETVDDIWERIGSRRQPARHDGPLRIGFIGSVYPHKGVGILVQSVQHFGKDQVECHIHGGGSESYVNAVRELDRKHLVRFHRGYDLAQLPSILEGLDLVVIPSVWEDCAPLVVAEALAARIPVVGSGIGGIPDFIQDETNGLLFQARDPNSLAAALNRFIQDPSLLPKMQQNIGKPRGFGNYLSDLLDHYDELIATFGKSRQICPAQCCGTIGTTVSNEGVKTVPAPTSPTPRMRQKFSLFHTEGREETIKKWISPYADVFKGCSNVLDIGCGPGLFLEALTERGISCRGVDYDPDMIDACGQRGLKATVADARSLEGHKEDFDGIHLGHVIEHMVGDAALKLLMECTNALRPAGLLLIRTPNWQNETVRWGGFWLDLTHVRPYPLELLERIFIDLGLEIVAKGFEEQGWNDLYILGRKKEVQQDYIPNKTGSAEPVGRDGRVSVIWEGSQFVYHSLALINRELCLKLIDAGHNVAVIPYEKDQFGPEADPRFHKIASCVNKRLPCTPDVHVRHQWPPNFAPPPSGHWVMIQPWEFGRLPEDWIEPMSDLVDEIWVPSKYVLKTYVASGIPVERVRVIPNGVNTDLFHPGAAPHPLPTRKKFKFLFVGGTIWRKGIDLLLEAYRSTFRREDDVVLIVKDIGVDSFYKGQGIGDIIRQIQDDPAAPELVYLTEMIEEQDIPGLFTACNCLAHPYRGEGFGLPVLEAMACGIPVIVTSGGATDDFCLQEFSYQIPAGRREANVDGMRLAGGAGYVLEPDLQSIRDMLRTVYENPAIAKQKAQSALEHVRKRYAWDNVAGLVQDRIRSLAREPIHRLNAQKLASGIRITPAKQEGLSLST